MSSQIPFTPLTPESMGRLTLDEQLSFEAAACAVAGDQKPSLEVVATLVLTVQRLITEPAAGPGATPMCPGGCGCRLGTDDADRSECGCDGGCCGE